MKTSDELFCLIKSLSPTEKRYFRIMASKFSEEEDKKYLQLFDAIEKQKEYNELKIKKQFANASFIKYFSVVKVHLNQLILKNLRNYFSELSVDIRIRNSLNDIDLLFNKALYSQCLKLLAKTKKTAQDYEKHTFVLDCLLRERQLNGMVPEENSFYEKNIKEEKEAIKRIYWKNKFTGLSNKIFSIYKIEGTLRDKDKIAEFEKEFSPVLLSLENKASAFDEKKSIYLALNCYYSVTGDFKNAYINALKAVELVETNTLFNRSKLYISALNNLLSSSIAYGNESGIDSSLTKLKALEQELPPQKSYLKANLFRTIYTQQLSYYLSIAQFEKGFEIVDTIEKGIAEFGEKIESIFRIYLYDNLALLYFCKGNFHKSLFWLNKLLQNEHGLEDRGDIIAHAKVFHLIIHYELDNRELLEYITKSTYRFLYKRERLYAFENIILVFLRRLPGIKSEKKLKEAFKELKSQFITLLDNEHERKIFDYFDYIAWLDSKIENKNFADLLKEKVASGHFVRKMS